MRYWDAKQRHAKSPGIFSHQRCIYTGLDKQYVFGKIKDTNQEAENLKILYDAMGIIPNIVFCQFCLKSGNFFSRSYIYDNLIKLEEYLLVRSKNHLIEFFNLINTWLDIIKEHFETKTTAIGSYFGAALLNMQFNYPAYDFSNVAIARDQADNTEKLLRDTMKKWQFTGGFLMEENFAIYTMLPKGFRGMFKSSFRPIVKIISAFAGDITNLTGRERLEGLVKGSVASLKSEVESQFRAIQGEIEQLTIKHITEAFTCLDALCTQAQQAIASSLHDAQTQCAEVRGRFETRLAAERVALARMRTEVETILDNARTLSDYLLQVTLGNTHEKL